MLYAESDLVIPSLKIIAKYPKGVRTEVLIKELVRVLKPEGRDVKILRGRHDTHFSQKVRNLKSHNTLKKKELADYRNGLYFITEKGKSYLAAGFEEIADALREQGFSEIARDREFRKDYEDIIVEEGFLSLKNVKFRERSRKLKQFAEHYFRKNGRIPCEACNFDFLKSYGERGRDYIEIHHTHPIHEHETAGEASSVRAALKKLAPLCSNCHRMVHRRRDAVLSVLQLKKILENAKTKK